MSGSIKSDWCIGQGNLAGEERSEEAHLRECFLRVANGALCGPFCTAPMGLGKLTLVGHTLTIAWVTE